jgi:hypothetical protein
LQGKVSIVRIDGPLLFDLQNAGKWDFDGLAISADRWNAKGSRDSPAFHKISHSRNAYAPAFCQLARRHCFKLRLRAGHKSESVSKELE